MGTTENAGSKRYIPTVHPHVRGDDVSVRAIISPLIGSPPRAWGRRRIRTCQAYVLRFTPTCVGTTCTESLRLRPATVHPHVRGDDLNIDLEESEAAGSPPRAWGRPGPPRRDIRMCRFTPTCVGTTIRFALGQRSNTVHPHVRGDDVGKHPFEAAKDGSPPRAWGRRRQRVRRTGRIRFTPTCVGTTGLRRHTDAPRTVHPHVRGDDVDSRTLYEEVLGSPPRAWGRR